MKVQSRETLKRSPICSCSYKVAIAVMLFVTLFIVSSARAQAPLTVEWKEGRLNVTAERVPLAQILQAVARRTGVEIRGLEGLQEKTSVHFANLPLREGLQKLLTPVNYFLLEKTDPRGDTQPTLVLVSGRQAIPPSETIVSEEGAKPEGEPVAEEDQEERLTALYTSAAQGDEEALQKAVSDPDQTIQATAFELLAQQNRRGATTLLVEMTKSEQSELRLQALHMLNQVGQAEEWTLLPVLGEALADEDVTVKDYAIQALAERGRPEALGALRQALRDPDPSVRMMVIENVSQKEEGLPLLHEALSDADETVRSLAAFWLEQAVLEGR